MKTEYLLGYAMLGGGCALVFILRRIKTVKDRRDSNRIYKFLRRSAKDGQYVFRSSEAISTVTNLPVSRVADLCSKHPHIESKEHERHMWHVVGSCYKDVIHAFETTGNVSETHEQAGHPDFETSERRRSSVSSRGSNNQPSLDMVLDLLPPHGTMLKTTVIQRLKDKGIGEKRARRFISTIIAPAGPVHEWHIKRFGKRDAIHLSQQQQPDR